MRDTVRPNIEMPATLWGEVKVSAFRRGIKPCEVVLELIREKFTEAPREARKGTEVASVVAAKAQVASVSRKPSVEPEDDFADPGEVLMGKCSKCLDSFPVTALISYPQFPNKKFCPGCVENMKNGQG